MVNSAKWTLEERSVVYFLVVLYPAQSWDDRARVWNQIFPTRNLSTATIKYDWTLRFPHNKERSTMYARRIEKPYSEYNAEEVQLCTTALASIIYNAGQSDYDADPAWAMLENPVTHKQSQYPPSPAPAVRLPAAQLPSTAAEAGPQAPTAIPAIPTTKPPPALPLLMHPSSVPSSAGASIGLGALNLGGLSYTTSGSTYMQEAESGNASGAGDGSDAPPSQSSGGHPKESANKSGASDGNGGTLRSSERPTISRRGASARQFIDTGEPVNRDYSDEDDGNNEPPGKEKQDEVDKSEVYQKVPCIRCKTMKKGCDVKVEGRPCLRCQSVGIDAQGCVPREKPSTNSKLARPRKRKGGEEGEAGEGGGGETEVPKRRRQQPSRRGHFEPSAADHPYGSGYARPSRTNDGTTTDYADAEHPPLRPRNTAPVRPQTLMGAPTGPPGRINANNLERDLASLMDAYRGASQEIALQVLIASEGSFSTAFNVLNAVGHTPQTVPEEANWTRLEREAEQMDWRYRLRNLAYEDTPAEGIDSVEEVSGEVMLRAVESRQQSQGNDEEDWTPPPPKTRG